MAYSRYRNGCSWGIRPENSYIFKPGLAEAEACGLVRVVQTASHLSDSSGLWAPLWVRFESRLIGYARVSTRDQDLVAPDAELMAAGCAKVFKEKVSGAKAPRC
jgi:hypothetical protein